MPDTSSQADKRRQSKKVIACLALSLLAFFAVRTTYLESSVVMGHGWNSTARMVVLGTPYSAIENANADQIEVMQSGIRNSQIFIICLWVVAMAIIVFWKSKKHTSFE